MVINTLPKIFSLICRREFQRMHIVLWESHLRTSILVIVGILSMDGPSIKLGLEFSLFSGGIKSSLGGRRNKSIGIWYYIHRWELWSMKLVICMVSHIVFTIDVLWMALIILRRIILILYSFARFALER